MFPARFDYAAPETVESAVERLAAAAADGREARVVAGGQSLLPELKRGATAPDLLVDVSGIDALRGVAVTDDGVRIGAATPYVDAAARLDDAGASLPLLSDALAAVGDRQVRNRGTVGGNLAQAEAGTDLPAPVLARAGGLTIRGPGGERTPSLAAFYADGASLAPAEVLTAVRLPPVGVDGDPDGDTDVAGAYLKREHPHTGYPLVGVAALLSFDEDRVARARVAATGATATAPAVRLDATEAALRGVTPDPSSGDALASAATRATVDSDPETFGDDVVVPEYRDHLLDVFTERALARAVERRQAVTANSTRKRP
jgi:carbon-monoxide dehydrogenase medium subunit